MRYPAEHKQETRARIVRAASRRFRRRGADGVAIAALMRELKLTHGGFYRHFRSKEALFAEAVTQGFDEVAERMRKAAVQAGPGREAGAIIDTYLGDQHCANPADGCPLAALAAELARQPRGMRLILERATQAYADGMAAFMPGRTVEQRRKQAMVLFSGMAGTLSLARAVADDTLRASILQTARTSYRRVFTADG